jgi:hypothetical protein
MFYLVHSPSGQLAHNLATGEHDAAKTNRTTEAKAFDTFGEASDYGQNFGPDWHIEEA